MKAKSNTIIKQTKKRDLLSSFLRGASVFAAILTAAIVLIIIGWILIKGIPNLDWSLFEPEYNTTNVSLFPALVNTVTVTVVSLLIAVPVGVFGAICLVEYTRRGGRFVKIVRTMSETLAGIPSIVYGLFGFLMFSDFFGLRYSLLAGSLTLAIMILPLVMRTTEESLMAVPDSYREGSYGVGAGKLRTVFVIVLPAALPGIFAGIILSIGRIVGETAALIYTAGTVANIPDSLLGSGRTLAVHMYALTNEGLYTDQAYATAVVLLVLVAGINALSSFVARKLTKGRK